MKKRLLALMLLLLCCLSLCACDTVDTVTSTNTGNVHIERYYQDNGDLFCVIETNTDSGVVVSTYFYWQHDSHGNRTLLRTECITLDGEGKVASHVQSQDPS